MGRAMSDHACFHCNGTGRIANAVKVSLDRNEITVGWSSEVIHLAPQEASLMFVLAQAAPKTVYYNPLYTAIWGANEPGRPENTTKVLVSKVNRKIASFGIFIKNVSSIGYYLDQLSPDQRQEAAMLAECIRRVAPA